MDGVLPTYWNHETTEASKRPLSFHFHANTQRHGAKIKQRPPWCSMLHLHCIFSGPPRKHRLYSMSLDTGPSLFLSLQICHLLPSPNLSFTLLRLLHGNNSPAYSSKFQKHRGVFTLNIIMTLASVWKNLKGQ